MKRTLSARVDGMDLGTGAFGMTLATEGEASDGDILSIAGGKVPARMPLLTSHWNDPSAALGSVSDPIKVLDASPPRLTATGHVEMEGDGPLADVRRDIAFMVDKGHINAVSIRWADVPGKSTRRVNLPSDHPHFVDSEKEKDPRKRWGVFFSEWRALEGSVVAIGADPKALIGRADETRGEVAEFWRAMADDAQRGGPRDAARLAAGLAAMRVDAVQAQSYGASRADLLNAVIANAEVPWSVDDFEPVDIDGDHFFLPGPAARALGAERSQSEADIEAKEVEAAQLRARNTILREKIALRTPDAKHGATDSRPTKPVSRRRETGDTFAKHAGEALRVHDKKMTAKVEALLRSVTGKVD